MSEGALSSIALLCVSLVVLAVSYRARGRSSPAQSMDERMWQRALDEQARMRVELDDLHRQLVEYVRGVRVLINQVLRLGEQPEWTPPIIPPQPMGRAPANPQVALLRALETLFGVEDLELLATTVGASVGEIAGDTIRARALALAEWCRRRDRMADLYEAVRRERPNARLEEEK